MQNIVYGGVDVKDFVNIIEKYNLHYVFPAESNSPKNKYGIVETPKKVNNIIRRSHSDSDFFNSNSDDGNSDNNQNNIRDNNKLTSRNLYKHNSILNISQSNSANSNTKSTGSTSTNTRTSSQNRRKTEESNIERFNGFILRHGIQPNSYNHVSQLKNYKLSIVIDDSISMEKYMYNIGMNRWQDQKRRIQFIFDLYMCLNEQILINLFFMNNGYYYNVSDPGFLERNNVFTEPTLNCNNKLITRTLIDVFNTIDLNEKNLILVYTDGFPTEINGDIEKNTLRELYSILLNKPQNIYISFCLLSLDNEIRKYFYSISREIPGISLSDEYYFEKHRIFGNNMKGMYSYGDYIIRNLLLPIEGDTEYAYRFYSNININNTINEKNTRKKCYCKIM
jgi:hypothetical protein